MRRPRKIEIKIGPHQRILVLGHDSNSWRFYGRADEYLQYDTLSTAKRYRTQNSPASSRFWVKQEVASGLVGTSNRFLTDEQQPLTIELEAWNCDSQRKCDCHSWGQKGSTPEDVISLKNLPLFSHFDSEEGLWVVGCGLKSENPRKILEHTYYLRALVQSNKGSLIDNGLLRIFYA